MEGTECWWKMAVFVPFTWLDLIMIGIPEATIPSQITSGNTPSTPLQVDCVLDNFLFYIRNMDELKYPSSGLRLANYPLGHYLYEGNVLCFSGMVPRCAVGPIRIVGIGVLIMTTLGAK